MSRREGMGKSRSTILSPKIARGELRKGTVHAADPPHGRGCHAGGLFKACR